VYDASTEPREFVGLDRAEAVGKACGYFRLREDELSIHELDAKEIYGLSSRTVVVAVPAGRQAREGSHGGGGAAREEGRGRRGRDGGGERDRGRGEGRSGGRGERGDRGGDRERGGQRSEGRGGRRPEAREPREEERRPARPAASAEPSVGTAQGALSEIGSFVLGAVERMGLGPFDISETAEEGVIVVALRGPAALALASGDGRPVDALQMLANQAAMRRSEEPDRVVLDVEGDLEEREAHLTELASRAARRARETGRAIALDPMSPRDRRAVHLALRDAQGIATMSVGESRFRQVVVVPEGAPEYEDAVRESHAAAASDEGA
jgi:spoIIIJ-associated protein